MPAASEHVATRSDANNTQILALERHAQLEKLAEGISKVAEELVLVLGILDHNLLEILILDKSLQRTHRNVSLIWAIAVSGRRL